MSNTNSRFGSSFMQKLRLNALDPHVSRLLFTLVGLVIIFLIIRPESAGRMGTWVSMGVQFPEFGIMALGVMVTMVTGGIDLSIVGIANLSGILAALTLRALADGGQSPAVTVIAAVLVSLIVGLLAGVFNGLLVAWIRIPAILATLGTLELFTGMGIMITGGKALSGLPPVYGEVFGIRFGGVLPLQLVLFVLVAVAVGLLMHRNSFGTKLFMMGTNPTAAKFSGLRLARLLVVTYTISGLCGSIAGLVMLANYNSAKPDYGLSYTLLTVLIVVLGGVNPNGGKGNIWGVILAILILQVLASGLNTFPSISNFYRLFIFGAVLLLVIWSGEKSFFKFKKKETLPK